MASGCETGMMYRLAEGQVLCLPVFAGNIISATFLAYAWDHIGVYDTLVNSGTKIKLLDSFRPVGAILITLTMLGVLHALTIYREKWYHRQLVMKR